MAVRRITVRLLTLAVVTLVGAGACALEPQQDRTGPTRDTPAKAAGTGVSAAPTPTRSSTARPAPTRTVTPRPPATTRPAPTATRSATPTGSTGGCPQGERQREVETHLARIGGFGQVTVDGRQSAEDCRAIKKFQVRYGIQPAHGRAGPTTADVARRLAETDTARCRTGSGTTICIDLTRQTVWVMRDGRVLVPPTVTRTGMPGYRTPTGTYTINYRNIREWSNPYEVWLPYWQHFIDGIGFHQTTTYLHDKAIGSHGCINLLPQDARRFWELGRVGARVYVFGRRPGT